MTNVQLCQCGREIGPRAHCPVCGSKKCYPLLRKKDSVTRGDGSTVELRVWRCTRCTHKFNDDDWMLRCQAQPEKQGKAAHRTSAKPKARIIPGAFEDPAVAAVLKKFFDEREARQEAEQRNLTNKTQDAIGEGKQ